MKLEMISKYPLNGSHPTPLLFIHGTLHTASCWDVYFLDYFAQHGYSSHAVNLRGHGHSEGREKLRWTRIADFAERANRFVGPYRRTSYPPSTPDKVADLFGSFTYTVSAPGDGTLNVSMEGFELSLVEVEPLYFRQVDGPFSLVFFEDKRGSITGFYSDIAPQYAAQRAPWYELASFNKPLVMISALLFILTLIVAPVQAIINRRRDGDPRSAARTARWILVAISFLNLVFLFGMMFGYHPPTELHSVVLSIRLLLTTTVISALLTIGALVYTVLAWKNRYWSVAFRTYYTLVAVAAVAFVWFLNQWNLLGWRF